jgi:acetylornithine/succinyldiaminopimelate/putrescine aminotransferase
MNHEENPFLRHGLATTTLHPLGLEVVKGEGPWIHLEGGGKLFDGISGIGVSSFGHGHPAIIASLHEQMSLNLHTMVYGELIQDVQRQAATHLRSSLPVHLDSVYFTNSGAEAVDAALKLAKRLTGRTKLMGVEGGYHGSTHGALSVSSNEARKAPFRPLLPEVSFLKWNDMTDLEHIDADTAAVIVETVQGDAGIRIPDKSWLQALSHRCREFGAMFILDEIQCGMGRTGTTWAFSQFEVIPDILCMGKALGGGMPVGAIATCTQRMSQLAHSPSLGHITTFGGHPMACAGVRGAFEALGHVDLAQVETRCQTWQDVLSKHHAVRQVRRLGAFMAVDMDHADQVSQAVTAGLRPAQQGGMGVLMFWFLSIPHAFRLAPPLTATDEEMAAGLELIVQALDSVK